jgi:murein L,D-transpeptidase YcbB/YkuD
MQPRRPVALASVALCAIAVTTLAPRASAGAPRQAATAGPAAGPAAQALQARVESLRTDPRTPVLGRRLTHPDAVAAVLERRQFAPPWALPEGGRRALAALRRATEEGLRPDDYHAAAIERALAGRAGGSPTLDADIQVLIADGLVSFADDVRYGRVAPNLLNPAWNVDPRAGVPALDARLEELIAAPDPGRAIEGAIPDHFIYKGLKGALAQLRAIEAAGGWPAVPAGPALKPGARGPAVVAVRKRLATGGLLDAAADLDSPVYDDALKAAVATFQDRHRLEADGVVGRTTVDAMNVPVATRIDQVRANLERARWVVNGLSDSFILVNLPAFKVYVIRDRRNVWEARAQVGKAARKTPSFRANMQYLVFNPDWTVPPTILREDVIGAMKKGQNAVARKGLRIYDRQGNEVPPASIDWSTASAGSFPYTLRQPPGPTNALGRVKFIFPNPHSIFLHDTPSRELFASDTRTFSSGCIRVEQPLDLAAALLDRQENWTRARIDEVVATAETQTVYLTEPLPVLIVYWTVSVGASGEIRTARDVYALDPPLIRALDR